MDNQNWYVPVGKQSQAEPQEARKISPPSERCTGTGKISSSTPWDLSWLGRSGRDNHGTTLLLWLFRSRSLCHTQSRRTRCYPVPLRYLRLSVLYKEEVYIVTNITLLHTEAYVSIKVSCHAEKHQPNDKMNRILVVSISLLGNWKIIMYMIRL